MRSLLILPLLCFVTLSSANDEKYQEAMKKNIRSLYEASGVPELQESVNSLRRISSVEKTRWEPYYYISLAYIFMATRDGDGSKKDSFLDLADEALKKAKELKKEDSEIISLEGFIHMIRLTVDPATRGARYAGLASTSYEKAIALNANNPRALALMAQLQFGTAKFFNQQPTEACNNAAKALALFNAEQNDNPLAPKWGKSMTEEMLKNCK
jgi:hypothetical protein